MKNKVVKSMTLGLSAVTLASSVNMTALAAEPSQEPVTQAEGAQELVDVAQNNGANIDNSMVAENENTDEAGSSENNALLASAPSTMPSIPTSRDIPNVDEAIAKGMVSEKELELYDELVNEMNDAQKDIAGMVDPLLNPTEKTVINAGDSDENIKNIIKSNLGVEDIKVERMDSDSVRVSYTDADGNQIVGHYCYKIDPITSAVTISTEEARYDFNDSDVKIITGESEDTINEEPTKVAGLDEEMEKLIASGKAVRRYYVNGQYYLEDAFKRIEPTLTEEQKKKVSTSCIILMDEDTLKEDYNTVNQPSKTFVDKNGVESPTVENLIAEGDATVVSYFDKDGKFIQNVINITTKVKYQYVNGVLSDVDIESRESQLAAYRKEFFEKTLRLAQENTSGLALALAFNDPSRQLENEEISPIQEGYAALGFTHEVKDETYLSTAVGRYYTKAYANVNHLELPTEYTTHSYTFHINIVGTTYNFMQKVYEWTPTPGPTPGPTPDPRPNPNPNPTPTPGPSNIVPVNYDPTTIPEVTPVPLAGPEQPARRSRRTVTPVTIDDEDTPLAVEPSTSSASKSTEKVEEQEEIKVEDPKVPESGEVKKNFFQRSWWWWLLVIIAVVSGTIAYEKKKSNSGDKDIK